ncbi:MAG TPA: M20/M25/M40 family metallo-hydrolase [Gemmatimonadaceae bacterium]|nr:M20/M25/M40 family metallo-hydrolase [Gemmatimonadaceae bacterium]
MTNRIRVLWFAGVSATILTAARMPAQAGPTTPAGVKRILSALADDSMEGRASGTPGAQRAARYIAGQMKAIGLEPLGDSGFYQRVAVTADTGVRHRLRLRDSFRALDTVPRDRWRAAANVLGVIRGADPKLKDEYVLVDAHYDHLGIGHSVNGDSIYNGADDDASGVTAVLEIARQLRNGPPPKRTVVFAAMMGEEVGLLGTRWYIAHPPIPLERMAANLEIEMIGRPDSLAGGVGKAWLTGYERSTMGDELAANGIPIVPDKRPDQHFFERSDNIAFAQRGIPAHTLSSFNLHSDYHQPSDDISKVDFVHMAGVINAGAKAVRLLTDGPKPEWKPGGRP